MPCTLVSLTRGPSRHLVSISTLCRRSVLAVPLLARLLLRLQGARLPCRTEPRALSCCRLPGWLTQPAIVQPIVSSAGGLVSCRCRLSCWACLGCWRCLGLWRLRAPTVVLAVGGWLLPAQRRLALLLLLHLCHRGRLRCRLPAPSVLRWRPPAPLLKLRRCWEGHLVRPSGGSSCQHSGAVAAQRRRLVPPHAAAQEVSDAAHGGRGAVAAQQGAAGSHTIKRGQGRVVFLFNNNGSGGAEQPHAHAS